jgi:hypothetical protein
MNVDQQHEANHNRRMANEHRGLVHRERIYDRKQAAAEALIGELQGEAGHRYYINLLDRKGRFTGKIKESRSQFELIDYLIRNRYV